MSIDGSRIFTVKLLRGLTSDLIETAPDDSHEQVDLLHRLMVTARTALPVTRVKDPTANVCTVHDSNRPHQYTYQRRQKAQAARWSVKLHGKVGGCKELLVFSFLARTLERVEMKRYLKLLLGLMLAAVLLMVFAIWRFNSNNSCLMHGTNFTKIRELTIENKKYHLYSSISGFQDKVFFISLTQEVLPETVCNYSGIKSAIYSVDIDSKKLLEKLLIEKSPEAGLLISPVYSNTVQAEVVREFGNIPIEYKGFN